MTSEISAPAAGWANTTEEESAPRAAKKADAIAGVQDKGAVPLGPPLRAAVRGRTTLAAAGMKRR